jgi:serine/threonine protein kinase
MADDSRTQEKVPSDETMPSRTAPPADDLVGRNLLHFRVVERLGAGGMGIVYRAFDEKLRRAVAIKLLSARYMADERNKELIMREARSAAALTHPNIAAIYEVHDLPEGAFYVMELVEGETLRQRIMRNRVTTEDGLRWGAQIAGALAGAHEAGIIHRDLKADNIMIAKSGAVKLLDFGLAKVVDTPDPEAALTAGSSYAMALAPTLAVAHGTEHGRVMGTPAYMAPEQARGEPVDARADVFAFGVVLYEMLTGALPFVNRDGLPSGDAGSRDWKLGAPLRDLAPKAPRAVERLVHRCLAFERENRLDDGGALANEIAVISSRHQRRISRMRMAAIITLVAVTASVVVTIARRDTSEQPPGATRRAPSNRRCGAGGAPRHCTVARRSHRAPLEERGRAVDTERYAAHGPAVT